MENTYVYFTNADCYTKHEILNKEKQYNFVDPYFSGNKMSHLINRRYPFLNKAIKDFAWGELAKKELNNISEDVNSYNN